jgi:hypothetical protein
MYHVVMKLNTYSSTLSSKPTLAAACDELATMYAYYAAYDNRKGWITQVCDTCWHGKVLRCQAPERHRKGSQHTKRCYTTCPTCHGHYETPVEA